MKLVDLLKEQEKGKKQDSEQDPSNIFKPFDIRGQEVTNLKQRLSTSYIELFPILYRNNLKDKIFEIIKSHKLKNFSWENKDLNFFIFKMYELNDFETLNKFLELLKKEYPEETEKIVRRYLKEAIQSKDIKFFDILIDKITDVNYTPKNEYTLLILACKTWPNGDVYMVKKLIEKGADVNAFVRDRELVGKNALWFATFNDNEEILSILLSVPNVNVNFKNEKFKLEPPLYLAARKGSLTATKMLLQHPDIDVNILYKDQTPLDIALYKKHWDIAKLLLQHGAITRKENLEDYKQFLNKE